MESDFDYIDDEHCYYVTVKVWQNIINIGVIVLNKLFVFNKSYFTYQNGARTQHIKRIYIL